MATHTRTQGEAHVRITQRATCACGEEIYQSYGHGGWIGRDGVYYSLADPSHCHRPAEMVTLSNKHTSMQAYLLTNGSWAVTGIPQFFDTKDAAVAVIREELGIAAPEQP